MLTKRQEELRAPINLPIKRDLIKIRECEKQTIENLTGDGYSLYENSEFCKLRDALVCRLTLFNARRGGEPSRMLLSELSDAMNEKWVNQFQKESIQDLKVQENCFVKQKLHISMHQKLQSLSKS